MKKYVAGGGGMNNEDIFLCENSPEGKYSFYNFSYDKDLIIELKLEEKIIKVSLGNSIPFFMFQEEETVQQKLSELYKKIPDLLRKNTFFQVKNSSICKKLLNNSFGLFEKTKLNHYLFVCSDHILNIVTMDEIEFLE